MRATFKVDDTAVRAYFSNLDKRIHEEVLRNANQLKEDLIQLVQTKLSGQVLQQRSGRLYGSIEGDVYDAGTRRVTVEVRSRGVVYARIQEYGGDVYPVNATYLHFVLEDGREIFSKHVRVPERSYLRSSLDREKIREEMKRAVREATRP